MILKKNFWLFLMVPFLLASSGVFADEWKELTDKHFIVYYDGRIQTEDALRTLRRAEEYYTRIAERIGYSRYKEFWTWDERVTIFVYFDQDTFVAETGQPPWSL